MSNNESECIPCRNNPVTTDIDGSYFVSGNKVYDGKTDTFLGDKQIIDNANRVPKEAEVRRLMMCLKCVNRGNIIDGLSEEVIQKTDICKLDNRGIKDKARKVYGSCDLGLWPSDTKIKEWTAAQKLKGLASAAVDYLTRNFVSSEKEERRKERCRTCDHRRGKDETSYKAVEHGDKCPICNCPILDMIKLESKTCPAGLW